MTHRLASLALLAALGSGAALAQDISEGPRGHLLIDAVALDRNGLPITDLRPDELEVWIGGYRVPIDTLTVVSPSSPESTGSDDAGARSIVLVLDDMTLEPVAVPRAREVARRFVNRMLPGDRMAIVMLNGGAMESTGDRARLLRAIDAYGARAFGVLRLDNLSEHVLTTVAALARQLTEAPGGRKTIVAIGAAWLFDTPIPPPAVGRDLRREWTDAVRAMAQAHANLYVIDPGGVGMSRVSGGKNGFAGDTGGYAFLNTNNLNAAADSIIRDAGNYYLIRVVDPPVGRRAELRELDVRVLRRGATIRARRAIPGGR